MKPIGLITAVLTTAATIATTEEPPINSQLCFAMPETLHREACYNLLIMNSTNDSGLPEAERRKVIDDFESSRVKWLRAVSEKEAAKKAREQGDLDRKAIRYNLSILLPELIGFHRGMDFALRSGTKTYERFFAKYGRNYELLMGESLPPGEDMGRVHLNMLGGRIQALSIQLPDQSDQHAEKTDAINSSAADLQFTPEHCFEMARQDQREVCYKLLILVSTSERGYENVDRSKIMDGFDTLYTDALRVATEKAKLETELILQSTARIEEQTKIRNELPLIMGLHGAMKEALRGDSERYAAFAGMLGQRFERLMMAPLSEEMDMGIVDLAMLEGRIQSMVAKLDTENSLQQTIDVKVKQ